jgi:hypothetical protein
VRRVVILTSRVEAVRVLQRVGLPPDAIDETLRQLPDPLDFERAILRRGLTLEWLMDRMGGSP